MSLSFRRLHCSCFSAHCGMQALALAQPQPWPRRRPLPSPYRHVGAEELAVPQQRPHVLHAALLLHAIPHIGLEEGPELGGTRGSPCSTQHGMAPHHGMVSPLTILKPSRKSVGSSSALVCRALASTGAMTLRHSLQCSRMISPMLLKSRSASTCGDEVGSAGKWHLHPAAWQG